MTPEQYDSQWDALQKWLMMNVGSAEAEQCMRLAARVAVAEKWAEREVCANLADAMGAKDVAKAIRARFGTVTTMSRLPSIPPSGKGIE